MFSLHCVGRMWLRNVCIRSRPLIILILALSCIILNYSFPSNFYPYNGPTSFQNMTRRNVTNRNPIIIPRNIIQTGVHSNKNKETTKSFRRLNPNHSYLFYDDAQAREFVRKYMSPEVTHAYEIMPRAVLKADYFRYISIYVLGGVYSDTDTECVRPIDTWTENYTNVGLIVGIEEEGSVEKLRIARPVQLCQWTFAAIPNHPVLGRIISKIEKQTENFLNVPLSISVIMNWTGPGLWTDIVFDYLKETYNFEWTALSKLQRGRLIGDIYILPRTGFRPNFCRLDGEKRYDREARVYHHFHGSWKRKLPQK